MIELWLVALIVAIGISIAIIATLIGYLRVILGISSILSLNTKCMAIGWKYLRKENIQTLYESKDISDILSHITSSGYKVSSDNPITMERDIERELVRIYSEIKAFSPDPLKKFIESYMLKYDALIAKRIITAKLKKIPKNQIYDEVYPVNYMTKLIIEHMIEAENVEEAVRCLDATPFRKCIETWENTKDAVKLELSIDKVFFEELRESTKIGDENLREALKRFVGVYIDIHNLKTTFRCKFIGLKNIEEYIVDGGRELPPWRLKSIYDADSIESSISQLDGTSYYKFLYDTKPDITEIEKRLDLALLKISEEIHSTYSNSIGPTLRFLVSKEYEANNIKTVIRGIESRVAPEVYEEVLITCE